MKKLLFFALAVVSITGCVKKQELVLFNHLDQNRTVGSHEVVSTELINTKHNVYKFRAADRIAMTIYGQPEYSTAKEGVLIDNRGYANLPMVGKVKVAGLSESKAASKIQALIRKNIVDAIVTVENPDKKVFVIGEINNPGPIKLQAGDITLLRAIGSAGGFKDSANKDVVYIMHKKGSEATLERVSLTGEYSLQDAFKSLVPGDIVYVAPTSAKLIEIGPMKTMQIISSSIVPVATIRGMTK
jgi:polysaccharide export outer membrane protein